MHTTSVISQIFFLFFYFLLNSQIFYVSTRGRISQFFFSFFRVYTLLRKKKVEAKNTILFFLSTFGLLFQLTGMTSYFPILRLSFALRISLQVLKRNSRSSHFAHRIIVIAEATSPQKRMRKYKNMANALLIRVETLRRI